MAKEVSVQALKAALEGEGGTAVLDVRETAEYNLAHIAGSCSLPRRLIEFRVTDLVPFFGTPTVVCDDDGRRAALAAATLGAMGYTNVAVLSGGLNRWVTEGLSTEWGMNVPSKEFGEKLLLQGVVPEITPDALNDRLQRGEKLLILDSRTPEEHQRACIPGSRSMPGAELGLRIWELLEDLDAPVVVHCAGRTRSIVGAGTLRRVGLKNVFALKNGTMGWQLAGLTLENGSTRLSLPKPSPENAKRAETTARGLADADGVRFVDVAALQSLWAKAQSQNVYSIDVRSREEYVDGHIPGFRWVPGGQAVQGTDSYVAVRDGTIVFTCDGAVRAGMTASWFRQMGYPNVYVLDGGTGAWQAAGLELDKGMQESPPFGFETARKRVKQTSPSDVNARLRSAVVVFVGTSDEFSAGHTPGATWVSRSWLEPRIGEVAPAKGQTLIVSCPDGINSTLAGATLLDLGYSEVGVLDGGMRAWRAAGLTVETGLTGVTQAPNDVLPGSRSYAEMLNYLRWEEELGHKYEASTT